MPIPATQQLVVEVQMQGLVTAGGSSNKNANFIFHFRRPSAATAINKAAVETQFQATVGAAILAALNNRYTQTFNQVRVVNDAQDPFLVVTETGVGAVTGDSMPMDLQLFILGRSALRGKSFKGGKKLFPLSEADTTAPNTDILNTAALARFTAVSAAWLAGFTAAGDVFTPVILSRTLSQLKTNPTTVVATDMIQPLVNKRLGRNKKHEVKSVY